MSPLPPPRASVPAAASAIDTRFFGHPRGLATLFFTEMWERFSYYGMRAILMLFMITAAADGGLGFTTAQAAVVYGIYTSLVYLLPLAGGWLADNVFGLKRTIFYGGVVIMFGHICLAVHGTPFFFTGLALVVLGTGLLKPNISALVGQLYTMEDRRRDSGFSIFYMGINLGAFLAPLVCGYLAQDEDFRARLIGWGIEPSHAWHYGFGAAAIGMFFGLVQYLTTGHYLGEAGRVAPGAATPELRARARRTIRIACIALALVAAGGWFYLRGVPAAEIADRIHTGYAFLLFGSVLAFFVWLLSSKQWTALQRRRLIVVAILFVGACVFWGAFEQAGSTLTLFAEKQTRNALHLFGTEITWKASQWQAVQPGLIVLLAPAFAWLWSRVGDRDPTSVVRFAVGILCAGLGFAWLVGGARGAQAGEPASPIWLFGVYFLHTIGELCLSAVGLSSMTKLAAQRVVGMMLGVWFASISIGSFLGGSVAGVYERFELPTLFAAVAASSIAMAVLMALMIVPARRLLDAKD